MCVAAFSLLGLCAGHAEAHSAMPMGATGGGRFDFTLKGSVLGVLSADAPGFGGVEALVDAGALGFGFKLALGYEHVDGALTSDGAAWDGGYLGLGVLLKPMLFATKVYRWVDPWVELGGRIGFVSRVDTTAVRSVGTIGVGLDVRLAGDMTHPALTIIYRYEGARSPAAGGDHLLLFGLGVRLTPEPE